MDNGASSYRRFLEGDDSGFVEIVRDYKDGLMLYINGYVKNITVAEDLMEDTFVKLVARRPKYVPRYSFKTWLYSIGKNIAIDYLRKASTRYEQLYELRENDIGEQESIERSYLHKEEKVLILNVVDTLPQDYRQVLYLHFFEGMSNGEIAKVMGKNTRQIENLMYRAKLSLRTKLEKEGYTVERL